jgi:hypothetical protein
MATPASAEAGHVGSAQEIEANAVAFDENARRFGGGRGEDSPFLKGLLSGSRDDRRSRADQRKGETEQKNHRSSEMICEESQVHGSINGACHFFVRASLPDQSGSQRRVYFRSIKPRAQRLSRAA